MLIMVICMYSLADSNVGRLRCGIEQRICLIWKAFVVFDCNKTVIGDDLFNDLYLKKWLEGERWLEGMVRQ